jgi:hypothetical protein
MKLDYPGIGGSLGQCVLCGESFAMEVILGKNVPMIGIDGFGKDLPVHQKCLDSLMKIKGQGWESLPEGPLRQAYAEHFAEHHREIVRQEAR